MHRNRIYMIGHGYWLKCIIKLQNKYKISGKIYKEAN